jgi:hypothetical protein
MQWEGVHRHKKETGISLVSQLGSRSEIFGRTFRKLWMQKAVLKGFLKMCMKVPAAEVLQRLSYLELVASFISTHHLLSPT